VEAPADEPLSTVAARIQARMSQLRTSERKVARALLGDYPVAGLETVASLAAVAGVSAPTVTRFATRLGYSGFPEVQRELRRELNNLMGSPLEQYPDKSHGDAGAGNGAVNLVATAMSRVVPEDLQRATSLLSRRSTVSIVGGRFSRSLGDYLYFHLMLLRRSIVMIGDDELQLRNHVASFGRQDVVVLFDYRRYDDQNVRLVKEVRARGGAVVLFTDVWLSPASDFADVVFSAPVATVGGFDSLVGPMAVCDQVISSVAAALGASGRDHLVELDEIREALGGERPAELPGASRPRASAAGRVGGVSGADPGLPAG
jgi:DNA-binding MurR/RpiR family transcriptional regulator